PSEAPAVRVQLHFHHVCVYHVCVIVVVCVVGVFGRDRHVLIIDGNTWRYYGFVGRVELVIGSGLRLHDHGADSRHIHVCVNDGRRGVVGRVGG
ncbi:hypothetical protein HK405_003872, partial [Cladochytrium tenue]